ncbi:Uncharacterized protein APZ42_031236 [Daphnia magna]|uniref:Uncharacterized protein n=1 Tax=Daphnia magna TaxID=35525 RepID=A0A164N1X3_9CRUS|nr:Uncharacterized protein APZ42_031236 [Daphnia magna]
MWLHFVLSKVGVKSQFDSPQDITIHHQTQNHLKLKHFRLRRSNKMMHMIWRSLVEAGQCNRGEQITFLSNIVIKPEI